MTTTPQAALLREAAQNALTTLDGIANANPRDKTDFDTPDEWIAWAKSRARWAADALREPVAQEVYAERILKQMLHEDSKATQAEPPKDVSMPQYWSVDVFSDGAKIVSIGNDWLSGERPLDEIDERTIIGAAQHLLSFVGYGLPPTSFDPDAQAEPAQAGELPPYIYGREAGPNEKVWTEQAVRAALSARNPSQPLCRLRIGVDGKYVEATEGQGGFPVVLQQPCQASTPATYDHLEFQLIGDASDGCGNGPAGETGDQS